MLDSSDKPPLEGLLETYELRDGWERHALRALGTENVFLLRRPEGEPSLGPLVQRVFDLVLGLERTLSKFDPQSELAFVNSAAAQRPVVVGPDLLRVLTLAREAWERTEGAFDPAIGLLLELWGLVDMTPREPSDEEIAEALEIVGMRHVEIDVERATVRFARPGPILDLGGIGKGYIVDRVVELLRAGGVEGGAVVAGRSTIATWGRSPSGERWRAAIEHPSEPGEVLFEVELVEPGVLSSSGAAERRLRRGSREWGHVIDPRTGRPVRTILGATVWTRSAILGDVLSTALFVLGGDATRDGGPLESLARAWAENGDAARASLIWLEENPGVWGGIERKRKD
ncbi:MAG TPA: FAD:protein FMN transferase, partial [Planctomycetota bacterium]|nr:FAD:protein FMN transferase [Planctomycetota bacterium]